MESRKLSSPSAGRSFGLFNSPTSQNNFSVALKPPIEISDVDSVLTTINTADNSEIIVGFETGTIYVFDDETGELKHKIAQTDFTHDDGEPYWNTYYYDHQLRHVTPYQKKYLLAANNLEIRMLDRETGEKVKSLPSFSGERICGLLETSDGNIFSACCPANLLRLSDSKTGAVIWEHPAAPTVFHNSYMTSLSTYLSNDERLKTLTTLASYVFGLEEIENVYSVVKCPNGDIACGTTGGTIFILDAESGKYKNAFRAYEGEKREPHGDFEIMTYTWSKSINVLAALPNNDIVSGAQNGPLFIWDHQTGSPKHRLVTDDCNNFRVTDIKIFNDLIISKSEYGPSVCIWDSNTGECLKTITGLYANQIAVTKDGDLVFSRGLHHGEGYNIYRLPIAYVLQHELKSIPLDKIPFPETEIRESNRKSM